MANNFMGPPIARQGPLPIAEQAPQQQQGLGGAFGRLLDNPMLLNLMAQSGYSPVPQSPIGAVGRAGIATREQGRQAEIDDLKRRMMESQIKLNDARATNPLINQAKPPASIAEYNLYSDQTQAAGQEPLPFDQWIRERESLASFGRAAGQYGVSTPAQTAADQAFAQTYVEWTQGGQSDALKGISQLREAREAFNTKNVSGKDIALIPDAALPFVNPDAANTKAQIEEVVQRNLRIILGAQFTEREGERLIKRAFDPALDEDINAGRLDKLIAQMEIALTEKNRQVQYYNENGTLRGYQGKIYTLADFESIFDDEGSGGGGSGDPAPKPTKRYNPETRKIEPI